MGTPVRGGQVFKLEPIVASLVTMTKTAEGIVQTARVNKFAFAI